MTHIAYHHCYDWYITGSPPRNVPSFAAPPLFDGKDEKDGVVGGGAEDDDLGGVTEVTSLMKLV